VCFEYHRLDFLTPVTFIVFHTVRMYDITFTEAEYLDDCHIYLKCEYRMVIETYRTMLNWLFWSDRHSYHPYSPLDLSIL